MWSTRAVAKVLVGSLVALPAACGARSGLLVPANDGTVCAVPTGAQVSTILSGQTEPREVAVDARNAYVGNWGTVAAGFSDGSIVEVPLCGGGPLTLAATQAWPTAIAVDATTVYWVNAGAMNGAQSGAVMKVSSGGGPVVTLASGLDVPTSIAVDGSGVYWTSPTAVMTVSANGGPVTTLAAGQQPTSIAVDAANVYWSNNSTPATLARVPITGGAITTLISADAYGLGEDTIGNIVVDAGHVYWATEYGFVMGVSVSGGTPTTLASGQAVATGLARDATALYWATGGGLGGAVMKLPLAGGSPATLASQGGLAVAVNSAIVVWTDIYFGGSDGQGGVMVVAK